MTKSRPDSIFFFKFFNLITSIKSYPQKATFYLHKKQYCDNIIEFTWRSKNLLILSSAIY